MKNTIAAIIIVGALLAGCATPAPGPTAAPTQVPTPTATATHAHKPTDTPIPATPTSEPAPTATQNPCAARRADWDVEACGLPKIIGHDYIELEMIQAISKFRSCEGHEYSDDFERGSSMKHYFKPRESVDWAEIPIFSPVDGQIIRVVAESWPGSGQQILFQSSEYPAFIFQLFHI